MGHRPGATDTARADDLSGDGPFDSQLRASLEAAIVRGLRVALSAEARRGLQRVRSAVGASALDAALRHLDRAWRCLPEEASSLAPIYGRLLALEADDHEAALHMLRRAATLGPDPDAAALIAHTLMKLQRPEDARQQIESALAGYCALPGHLLARVAGEVARHPAIAVAGWIGRGPALELLGELSGDRPSDVLQIQCDGWPTWMRVVRGTGGQRRRFKLKSPHLADSILHASCHGLPLLGSGAHLPADFALDARIDGGGRRMQGWARIGWLPSRPVQLRLEGASGDRLIRTRRTPQHRQRWTFDIDLRAAGLRGSRVDVAALLPDGRWQPLKDSPFLLEQAVRLGTRRAGPMPLWSNRNPGAVPSHAALQPARFTDVIIPVYGALEHTRACLDTVLTTVDETTAIIVVDDANKDPALIALLDALTADGRITLLRNAENQGFVASVNRALALHPTHDAVLLNSDTRVFHDWLQRLRAAAYSDPAVGTVCPWSNDGSIVSCALGASGEAEPAAAEALDALAAATHSKVRVEIPVGVGFCLYVRRDCLSDVGTLDAEVFGKGYGEETDFCLRARRRGWSHLLAADVFVYHSGGVSFSGSREALRHRSQRLLNLRYPGYDRFVASFLAKDPLQPLRRVLDERRLSAFDRRWVLVVATALNGGVDRFVAERCRSLRAQGLVPLLLKTAVGDGAARRCELSSDAMSLPDLHYETPADLPALTALLQSLRFDSIEIQHFLHFDPRVIDMVRALPQPYDVFVHDYAWICPRITLIDGSGRYCGEPEIAVCESCLRRNGSNLGESISVAQLRARSATWLRGARQVSAPSSDAARRLRQHFDALTVTVQSPATCDAPISLPVPRQEPRPIRIALIGAIGEHKGYSVLLSCARDAHERRLPLEFVVIGYSQDDAALLETGKVFITGRYGEGEAPYLLRRERPDVVWLASVWPETWCYTLDYALATRLPLAAFDIGAIAERLRAAGRGELLPLQASASAINDRLQQLGVGIAQHTATASHSLNAALSCGDRDSNMMTTRTNEIVMTNAAGADASNVLPGLVQPPGSGPTEGLSASVQALPLPPGLYLFSVKAAGVPVANSDGQFSLPAMHVGLGPGIRSDQVEFMAASSAHGAWLFATTDLLVAKVHAPGVSLMLTSLRAPAGEVLSIKVERLRAAAEAAAGAATLTPPIPSAEHDGSLPVRIETHIRTRGDMSFTGASWAGRVGPGLWIESFSVRPLERFGAQDIEYKGLTGSGFETGWLSDGKNCGTQGLSEPLLGFALRFKPNPAAAAYDCEYSGYFQSGVTIGPLRNGAPCRSTVASDPLEGIQIRLTRRASNAMTVAADLPAADAVADIAAPTRSARPSSSRGP